jgi:sigma-B regulation protein RsbU (phosphoserine phosphatase)
VVVNVPVSPLARLQLRQGDEIAAINGSPVSSVHQLQRAFGDIPPDSTFLVTIRRNGAVLATVTAASLPIPFAEWLVKAAVGLLMPQIFLVTGLVVFLLKPYDKQAMLLALMFGMFIGGMMALGPPFAGEPGWLVAIMLVVHLASLFLWPVFLHFFQTFPEPSPLLRRAPRLEKLIYLPQLLTIFPYFATLNVLAAVAPDLAVEFQVRAEAFGTVSIIVAMAYIVAGLLSLLVNYREADLPARRKMRVMVAGSIAGFAPLFLFLALEAVFGLSQSHPVLAWYLIASALLAFPLFPLSSAYAIVRHRVIPLHLIVRRGIRYLLVSRGFIFIQAVAVFAVLSFLLTGSRLSFIDGFGARADIVVTMIATAMAIALLTFLNQKVMPVIDRRFFREAYDAQQILADLGLEVKRSRNSRQVIERATAKIHDALHVASVAVFLRDRTTGDFACTLASHFAPDGTSTGDTSGFCLPSEGSVCRRLRQTSLSHMIDLQRSPLWSPVGATEVDADERLAAERGVVQRLQASLLLPIATKDELLGVISMGPRLGDLPYSREDKQLLMAIAWQLAFAVQNAQLMEEAAEQERLRHELAIATNVQRRLFPDKPPEFRRLDLAGVCQPALGVGGDLYDFIVLDENKVGVAVADVAGKGISAALLMSTVQASLRIQAASVNGNLVGLVSSMNRLLHGSTDVSNYASFFYAQFDQTSGELTYVNAGHNPPMLIQRHARIVEQSAGRAAAATSGGASGQLVAPRHSGPIEIGNTVIRHLTTGGPLIGAFDDCSYEQRTLMLNAGDVLVAYTDGVTEAQNEYDEEFGEERLRELVVASLDLTAGELTRTIVDSVRYWSGGRVQQDDVTVVVMKVRD